MAATVVVAVLTVALGVVVPSGPAGAAGPFVVDSTLDAVDVALGDGVCATAADDCTLRAAVQEANALPGPDTITIDAVAAPTITLTVPGDGEDQAVTGDLDVHDDVTIDGGGAVVDAAGLDRVFDVHLGMTTIHHVTITGGNRTTATDPVGWDGDGGGIRARATLVVEDATVEGNAAVRGGGILAGDLTVRRSTVRANDALQQGGGVHLYAAVDSAIDASALLTNTAPIGAALSGDASHADVTVVNTTISGNVGATSIVDLTPGSWPESDDSWALRGVTVADNEAPVAVRFTPDNDLSWFSTELVVVDHPDGQACDGFRLSGDSIATDASCGWYAVADPGLEPLADNGGPTSTHLPGPSSAAREVQSSCSLTTDQRGEPRPPGSCHAGAVQAAYLPPAVFEPTTGEDGADAAVGDGLCDRGDGECTLRAAVQEANAAPTADVIWITGMALQLTVAGRDEDEGLTGDLDVTDPLQIWGAGSTLDVGGLDRAFDVHDTRLRLEGLTMVGGDAGTSAGGSLRGSDRSWLGVGEATISAGTAGAGSAIATAGILATSDVGVAGSTPAEAGGDVFIGAGGFAVLADTTAGTVILGATHPDLDGPTGATTTLELQGGFVGDVRAADGRVDLIGDVPVGVTVEVAPLAPGDAPALHPWGTTNAGTIVLGGPVPGDVAMGGLSGGNAGTIEVRPGGEHVMEGNVVHSWGQFDVAAGASVRLDGTLRQTGGATTVDGTLTAGEVELGAGTLTGAGTIVAPLDAGACAGGCTAATWPPGPITIAPGSPLGSLRIDGAVALGSTTTVAVHVGAAAHDELRASGPVVFDAMLGVTLAPGVVPEQVPVVISEQPGGLTGDVTGVTGVPAAWVQTLPDRVRVDAVALFPDVPVDHPFLLDVAWAVALRLTTGYPDGGFHPTAPATRQTAVTWLWRLAGGPPPAGGAPGFVDVPADHHFHEPISWAAGSGAITGYDDGTFRPAGIVTRQAMIVWLWRTAGEPDPQAGAPAFTDVGTDHPFHDAISWAAGEGITTGDVDGSFRPGAPLSRQAAMAFLHRATDN